jgi:hypothetical protein
MKILEHGIVVDFAAVLCVGRKLWYVQSAALISL